MNRRQLIKAMFGAGAAFILGEATIALGEGPGGARMRDRLRRTARHLVRTFMHRYTVHFRDDEGNDRVMAFYDGDGDVLFRSYGPGFTMVSRYPGDPRAMAVQTEDAWMEIEYTDPLDGRISGRVVHVHQERLTEDEVDARLDALSAVKRSRRRA